MPPRFYICRISALFFTHRKQSDGTISGFEAVTFPKSKFDFKRHRADCCRAPVPPQLTLPVRWSKVPALEFRGAGELLPCAPCPLVVFMDDGGGAPWLHLTSHASRGESTHWSISICFLCVSVAFFAAPGTEEWRSAPHNVSE